VIKRGAARGCTAAIGDPQLSSLESPERRSDTRKATSITRIAILTIGVGDRLAFIRGVRVTGS
jgi:hypothetical protein